MIFPIAIVIDVFNVASTTKDGCNFKIASIKWYVIPSSN